MPSDEVTTRRTGAVRRVADRIRRLGGWLGLGFGLAALLLAGVLVLPSMVLRLVPPELRAPGEWRFTHRVEPVAGMVVTQRILTADEELTILNPDPAGPDLAVCTVEVRFAAPEPASPLDRPVRIRAWRAVSVDESDSDPRVTWSYAAGRRASVYCSRDGISSSTLLAVAKAVRFTDSRVRLPFTFDSLPRDYQVYSIDEYTGHGSDIVSLGLQPIDRASIPSIAVRYGSSEAAHRCLGEAGQICLSVRWSAEEAFGAEATVRQSLDRVSDRIRPAPDLADRSTWFDAVDLPR
jgi:hypothetical protein